MENTAQQHKAAAFGTGNRALVAALITAGVPFADTSAPFVNLYTEERLEELGVPTVLEAVRRRKPGILTYFLRPVKTLKGLLKAYSLQQERIRQAAAGVPVRNPDLRVDAMTVVQICAQYEANKKWLRENWDKVKPLAKIKTGETTFAIVSLGVSKETRERFSL